MVFGGVEKVRQIQRQGQKKRILDVCSFQLYFSFVAIILDHVLGLTAIDTGYGMEYGYLFLLYGLFILIPSFSVSFRRLHDQNKSGAWILINLIPFVGTIWYLVLMLLSGTAGSNKYGEDQKALESGRNNVQNDLGA